MVKIGRVSDQKGARVRPRRLELGSDPKEVGVKVRPKRLDLGFIIRRDYGTLVQLGLGLGLGLGIRIGLESEGIRVP